MTKNEALTVANGNELAADFVYAFVGYCHLLDDIIDKDKPVDDERLIRENIVFLEAVIVNPWARERMTLFWPLLVTSFNAWLDSNKWEKEGTLDQQRDADVVKGIYHEIVFWVAYLTGGWEHLRKVSSENREYDHDFNEKGKA